MSSPIEHVVVLMLENRSFDSLLGFHRPRSAGFEGLTGDETNPRDGAGPARVTRLSGSDGCVTDPDPHHEHEDAMAHLFNGAASDGAPTNQGFALRYQRTAKGAPLGPEIAAKVMGVLDTATQMPALATLVDHFRVCDHWFSSLPGPTWPNRFFAHCATSGGHAESPRDLTALWSEAGSIFNMPTIFENLSAAGEPWTVYYHDIPQALSLARLHHYRGQLKHFHAFLRDCATGSLPSYAFIEPGFFDAPLLNLAANDTHPPHDARRGDALIAAVYNALRANEALWSKSLLLVVWDEHGGFYDHVPPPAALPPDAASQAGAFKFDRLGVRVPAVVVSPWVAKGSVDPTVYDHASIPATLKKVFALPAFLTRRDANANTFDGMLLASARADTPLTITGADTRGIVAPIEADLHAHQAALLSIVSHLSVAGLTTPGADAADLHAAILHVARYLDI